MEPINPSDNPAGPYRPAYTPPAQPAQDRYWLHILLFAVTFISCVFAGGQLAGRLIHYGLSEDFGLMELIANKGFLMDGLAYGFGLLFFLTCHEFGHYFAARHHRIAASLPFYIPTPFLLLGTFGAVIRIREPVPTTRKLFDIGVAGPIAGFVVALGVLIYALATLPDPSYVEGFPGHEALKEYIRQYGTFPERSRDLSAVGDDSMVLVVGQTPLYWLLSKFFVNVPPMDEMYHYPLLFAGWLGLFFTALNLLPVGQLDGGHVLYALVGDKWHKRLARGFVVLLLVSGAIGFVDSMFPFIELKMGAAQWSWIVLAAILYFFLNRIFKGNHRFIAPTLLGIILIVAVSERMGGVLDEYGFAGWFVWCILILWLIKVDHPPVLNNQSLTPGRKALGILSIVIFILCFSLSPLRVG